MKNMLVVFFFIATLTLSTIGCSENLSPDEQARIVALDYMNTLYTVEDFTEFKTSENTFDKSDETLKELKAYTTDKMINWFWANRVPFMFYEASRSINKNICIDTINLEIDNVENNKICFDYTMNLKFTSPDKKDEYEELIGEIELLETNKKWKVIREKPLHYGRLVPLTFKPYDE